MPRIYAPKEDVNTRAGHVDFYNGAAAVDEDAAHAIAFSTPQDATSTTASTN